MYSFSLVWYHFQCCFRKWFMMKHLIWWWRLKLHGRLPWGLEGHYIRVALSLMISIAGHVNSYLRRRWSILPSSNGFPSLIIRKQCCCRNYFRGEENRPNITTWRQDTRFWESFVLCTAQHLLNQMMMLAFTSNQGKSLWKIQKILNLKDVFWA